jgi:hypothetical protein
MAVPGAPGISVRDGVLLRVGNVSRAEIYSDDIVMEELSLFITLVIPLFRVHWLFSVTCGPSIAGSQTL